MSTELHDIEFGRFARFGGFSDRFARPRERYLRPGLLGLPVLLIVGLVGWLVWDSGSAESEPAEPETAAIETLDAGKPRRAQSDRVR